MPVNYYNLENTKEPLRIKPEHKYVNHGGKKKQNIPMIKQRKQRVPKEINRLLKWQKADQIYWFGLLR